MSGHFEHPEEFHVLIVEDEARLRVMLGRAMTGMELRSSAAGTAEDGLQIMELDRAQIVLLDLRLPGMGGLGFFDIVRERWPNTQVIVLTGFGDLEAARKAIRLDVVDFLTKPFTLADLEMAISRAVRRLLERRQAAGGAARRAVDSPPEGSVSSRGKKSLDDVERNHILTTLDQHGGNRRAAAQALGISERTLYYRLQRYR